MITDRISAFDVVMTNGVPGKGKILSQLTDFWMRHLKEERKDAKRRKHQRKQYQMHREQHGEYNVAGSIGAAGSKLADYSEVKGRGLDRLQVRKQIEKCLVGWLLATFDFCMVKNRYTHSLLN